MRVVARKNSDPSRSTHQKIYKKHQEAVFSFQAKSKLHQIDTLNPCELFSRLFVKLQVDYNIYCLLLSYLCIYFCIIIYNLYANGDYTGIQYPYFPLYFKGLTAKRNVWLKCPNTRKINRASVACH